MEYPLSRPGVNPPQNGPSRRHTVLAGSALSLLAVAALFEPLFLDASVLSIDNRLLPPLTYHLTDTELSRPMNVLTTDVNGFFVPQALVSLETWPHLRTPNPATSP